MMQSTQLPPRRAGFCLLASLGALSTAGISLSPDEAAEVGLSGAANLSTGSARTSAAPPGPTDNELRTMILGRWQTVSNGTRVVENRPDGTASMELTFDFVASLLYGDRMQIELTWFISDGLLVYTMQSGKPKSPFDRIVSNYGSQATYRFHSIAADRMHLVRQRDATESYVWTRIGTEKK